MRPSIANLMAAAILLAQPAPVDSSLVQKLHADILASTSATLSLEAWCREHQMAAEPKISARPARNANRPPSEEQLRRLQVTSAAEVKYRRVELWCGTHLFVEADNWYVPARLTAEMNRALETSDAPFGRVVQPLGPYRRTFAALRLWPASSVTLFEHRAVLYTSSHLPFSEVDEVYKGGLLDFRQSR